ncbi:hypothetical protein THRCLA_21293 [Thraustotheca clavata]|uniref:EF-hand domain-containing protein n=1 Tax=Thraustotheca clavata TaxID=74557 RepID=A0A1V9ZY18_9STRA|nr:hypothetical protein THRCLA_21293 [Thraustotheca clavata]
MGQLYSVLQAPEVCDLSPEQLEELRMLTLLPIEDIIHFRNRYRIFCPDDVLTKEIFFSIPAMNPLKERLFSLFELNSDGNVSFNAFIQVMATFTYHSTRESKLRVAFKIHDIDGDNQVSKADLIAYMRLVTDFGEMPSEEIDKDLELAATRALEEASSDPSTESLSFDDFSKVVLTTDFETKLLIQI